MTKSVTNCDQGVMHIITSYKVDNSSQFNCGFLMGIAYFAEVV